MKEHTRFFKRVKHGMLDSVAAAYSDEYIAELIKQGYEEITREYYSKIMNMGDLYISYRYE